MTIMLDLTELGAPLQRFDRLGEQLGIDLIVQRDDLLPFPLAGNKVRKVAAELAALSIRPDVLITNGGIDSNHCRTVAIMAATMGIRCHLVLHGSQEQAATSRALPLLRSLGAEVYVVSPDEIRPTIDSIVVAHRASARVHVIPGGCHSPAGASAYSVVGESVFARAEPEVVFVASGTGATQGGLLAAASKSPINPKIVGISVARTAQRGRYYVREAANWAGAKDHAEIHFEDEFRAGGYGLSDSRTEDAVRLGWEHGLPLDCTYTGKAFAGLVEACHRRQFPGARVLFWHTGGLWNHLSALEIENGN